MKLNRSAFGSSHIVLTHSFTHDICSGNSIIGMNQLPAHDLPLGLSGRGVTAVLGPTNTGKT
ncbi:hypothetical protein Q0O39_14045, partial [Staphylococcus aureus]|nr:hypothetical protein [Staphylococcus aureus]